MVIYKTAAELRDYLLGISPSRLFQLNRVPYELIEGSDAAFIQAGNGFGHTVVLFLKTHGESPKSINLKDINPADIIDGFACGSVGSTAVCCPKVILISSKLEEMKLDSNLPIGSGN